METQFIEALRAKKERIQRTEYILVARSINPLKDHLVIRERTVKDVANQCPTIPVEYDFSGILLYRRGEYTVAHKSHVFSLKDILALHDVASERKTLYYTVFSQDATGYIIMSRFPTYALVCEDIVLMSDRYRAIACFVGDIQFSHRLGRSPKLIEYINDNNIVFPKALCYPSTGRD